MPKYFNKSTKLISANKTIICYYLSIFSFQATCFFSIGSLNLCFKRLSSIFRKRDGFRGGNRPQPTLPRHRPIGPWIPITNHETSQLVLSADIESISFYNAIKPTVG